MKTTSTLNVTELKELEKATVMKAIPDILITKYKPEVVINRSDAQKIDDLHCKLAKKEKVFIIVDMNDGSPKISKEAEQFFTRKAQMVPNIKGAAIVIRSKPSFFSWFLLKFYNTLYPSRTFASTDEAVNWLNRLRVER